MVGIQVSENDDTELITGKASSSGNDHTFFYLRRKGVDSKFTYSGHGQSSYPVDPFEEVAGIQQELGEEVERELLENNYPIRPVFLESTSGVQTGKIRIHYGKRIHEHSFNSHPGTVDVYATEISDDELQELGEGDFRVRVLDISEEQVDVHVTYNGGQPHEFAVREAVRIPFTFSSQYEDYPEIDIIEWDQK